MTDKQALRSSILAQTDLLSTKRRFGLFSHPISTAIGDDGQYRTKFHPRQQNGRGKPLTQPKNIFSGPCRSGNLKKSFFGQLNSLASSHIKDQYIDERRRLLKQQNFRYSSLHKNQNTYKPASKTGFTTLWKSSYPYQEQNAPQLNPKRNRQSDGKVKIQMRNIMSNPSTRIADTFFKYGKHLDDPYNRERQLQIEKMKKNKSLEGEQKFKPNSFHSNVLNKNSKVYGSDVTLKATKHKQPKLNIYHHQSNWKAASPNKHGIYGFFTSFPKYMENPPKQIKRREFDKKQVFKSMSSTLTTPSTSILTNPMNMNIRKYTKSSFSHHQ